MLRGPTWSELEVEVIVADYLSMLEKELRGIPYSKTEHRNALRPLLVNRSDGSIERKHQNISAVLLALGFPCIRGYKPLSQYQQLLAEIVIERVEDDAVLQELVARYVERVPEQPPSDTPLSLVDPPLSLLPALRDALAGHEAVRRARRINYLAREARNRSLGTGGETLVVSYERRRLSSLGCDSLAERVEHVSITRGDGLGYDVLSFTREGIERFIEVKTTQLGAYTPFFVTASELSFSARHATTYSLYRLFEFSSAPQMFILDGSVEETCRLTPSEWVATAR